jgi:hypothetical protein
MGRRFEDIPAYAMLATLQSLMIQEDRYIIGGCDCDIGAPSSLTVADSPDAGSLTALTAYDFSVSALTLHGYLNAATGTVGGVKAKDETDAVANTAWTSGAGVTAALLTWPAVKGAFAYNIYGITHTGTRIYLKTVTTNKSTVTTITGTAGHTANSTDESGDTYGYQGLLQQIVALVAASYGTMTAYYKSMDGAELSGDGAAGVTEIDTALQNIWNNGRISPTVMLLNAQESRSLKALAIGSAATNATRITVAMDGQAEFKAGAGVTAYYNPFTAQWIPLITSLHVAPGTILLIGERVPYPNSETPNNIEIELQQEYYAEEFARTARAQPIGVTCIGAQKLYFPTACGVIQNIAPTT